MSEAEAEAIVETESTKVLTFEEAILSINDKYVQFLKELIEKFQYHEELAGPLNSDLKLTNEKLPTNKYQVIDTITDNFLFCLEQLSDNNADYFIYQKEKIAKKNGKFYKNKLPKIGNKTLFKRLLSECDSKSTPKIFESILNLFNDLTFKNENGQYQFNEEYMEYVKNNFSENKNFSKMIMVFDNIDNILNSKLEEVPVDENLDVESEDEKPVKKGKKNKKSKKSKSQSNDFMKNLENTKIAQLAKNISEKINVEDFPALNDPTKLLSSLTGNGDGENGGINNLLKFVIGEVEQAFKRDVLNESDLMGEAKNIMGQFQNMSGFDPMSFLSNNKDNIDLNQFANIFSKMGK